MITRSSLATAGRIAAAWIPAILLIMIFAKQGLAKFDDTSGWAVAFRNWDYPVWFRITIGVLEVGAAALLLWGRTAPIGAMIIICVMLGGTATHIIKDGGRHVTSEIVPIALSTIILVVRRKQVVAMFRRE